MIAVGKASMLEWLAPRLTRGRVLPLSHFGVVEWLANRAAVLSRVTAALGEGPLTVRSSADGEDAVDASQAGRFLSVLDVSGEAALAAAIDRVVQSYGDAPGDHRVLVQPMLYPVSSSGVVFTRDPASGASYAVVNYTYGEDTAAVTGGVADGLQTFYCWKGLPHEGVSPMLADVLALAAELEQLLGSDSLDIEFGVTGSGLPVLFQVRPLVLRTQPEISAHTQERVLGLIAAKVEQAIGPKPYLHGRRTVFGVMPDWNPAEIIGVRPRPLALSLYRDLVTDSIWAYQRHNYGYKNLRSFPLLIELHGLPYIDVRVSFNSFVPADVEGTLADRLVDHYVDRLVATPSLHDKVEFEIVLSCYSFEVREQLARLPDNTFTNDDRRSLARSLLTLTNRIINNVDGLWRADAARIEELQRRHAAMMGTPLDTVSRIYWLLEDCKRYGTLPFAGLARAAFIATQMLRSMVTVGVLSADELERFMAGVESVSGGLVRDFRRMDKASFLEKYGHLRPGTYDILSPRYDEAPDRYFDWEAEDQGAPGASEPYVPSPAQTRNVDRLLVEHGLEHTAGGLFEFLESAIRNREHAKFIFTRSLSDALSLFGRLGAEHGFTADDLSFASIGCIHRLYGSSENPADVLAESIAQGRERHRVTRQLLLSPLLTEPADVWRFHQPAAAPNFITRKETVGTVQIADPAASLERCVVLLPNADPGYDWIFSRDIAGLVTAYGGVNSHMAVRAGELGLPAVIGAGERLYDRWSRARRLRLDCLNRQVQILQ